MLVNKVVVFFLYNRGMRVFCCLLSAFLMFGCLFADEEDEGNEEESTEEVLNENTSEEELNEGEIENADGENSQSVVTTEDQNQYRTKRYVRNLVDNILGGFVPDSRVANDKNYQNTVQIHNKINLLSKDILELQKYLSQYTQIKKEDSERAARFRADMQKALERFLGYELSEDSDKKSSAKSPEKNHKPKKSKKSKKNSGKKQNKGRKSYTVKNYSGKYLTTKRPKSNSYPRKTHSIFTVKNVNLPANYQNSYIGKPMPKYEKSVATSDKPMEFKVKYYGEQKQTNNGSGDNSSAVFQSRDVDIGGKKWTVKSKQSSTEYGKKNVESSGGDYFKKCPTCGK